MELSEKLYHARITQKQVAERAGVTGAMVSLVLNKKAKSQKVVNCANDLLNEKLKEGKIRYIC